MPFTRAEVTELTRLRLDLREPEGFIKILRFVPSSALPADLSLTGPLFLYPDEKSVKGSATLFSSLLYDLLAKDLIGIALFARNKSSAVRLVALCPQREVTEDDSVVAGGGDNSYSFPVTQQDTNQVASKEGTQTQSQPGGINVLPLPYAEEVRGLLSTVTPDALGSTAPPEVVEAATDIVRALRLEAGFSYLDLENPALQQFYSVLQARLKIGSEGGSGAIILHGVVLK